MNSSGHSQSKSGRGVLISGSEIERMRRSVLPPTVNDDREKKKKQLKLLSKEKVKNWPNTLEALRLKKESYMKEKAAQEELKRIEIDKEEAEIRRKTRIEAIERADKLMYEQTDRMKFLRSQQMYSDALYTRGFQIQDKKDCLQREKEEDMKYHQEVLRKIEAGEIEDREKEEELRKKVEEVAVSRKEQLAEVRRARQKAKQEEIEIGNSLREDAAARLEEERQARIEREARNRQANEEMIRSNAVLKQVRDEMLAAEEAAIRKREDEVEVIENRKKVRKALEIRKFEKAQVTRQKMIEAATKALAEHSNKEQAIMEKQANEQRAKEDKYFADKEARREKEWKEIVESRAEQVKNRKEQRAAEEAAEKKMLDAAMEDALRKEEQELAKERKVREDMIALKKETYQTAVDVEKSRKEQRAAELQNDMKFKDQIEKEDEKFRRVCKKEIERYAADGKPLYPLYKALEQKPNEIMAVTGFRI